MLISACEAEINLHVVKDGAKLYLWARPERAWLIDGPAIDANVTAFFADTALMMEYVERSRYISLHAAVLAVQERACALLGVSTAGKSTTAVACAVTGMRLLSDERCLIDAGQVAPFPRALTLRPSGRRRLLIDDGLDCEYLKATLRSADTHEDFVFSPSRLLPRVGGEAARLHSLFVIAGYAATPRVTRVDLFELLPEIMLSMTARERGLDRMARAIGEFQGLALYRLTLGAPSDTARLVARAVCDDN